MRIMTSNIWGDYFGNPVELREDQLFNVFKKYNPDILGVQEARMSFQKSKLFKKLGEEYAAIGVSDYEPVNHEPLFYKKKYKLIESGFEYLLDTPDLTKGITYAVLFDEENNKKFAVLNTHFWFKGGAEHDLLRVTNAKQIISRMKYLSDKYNCPSFMFGDLNCFITSEAYKTFLDNGLTPLYDIAIVKENKTTYHGYPQRGEDGFYHSTMSDRGREFAFDHILVYGGEITVSNYIVVEDQDALDATDHNPVFADVII